MLSLDSSEWSKLNHAYGPAKDIPALLKQLETFPVSNHYTDEPWYSLWSSLCHQHTIYPASFAAIPHIIQILSTSPQRASFDFFLLPAEVEICRQKSNPPIPSALHDPYFASLKRIPGIVGEAASSDWNENLLSSALCAIAAVKGFATVAEAVRELTPEHANSYLKWLHEQ